MKKRYHLLTAALLLAGAAHGQGTELFFSEYDEGAHQSGVAYPNSTGPSTGSERAIEIFNPTRNTVSLNPYSVRRYSNGSFTVTEEERLLRSGPTQQAVGANTLQSATTFVLASGEATLNAIRDKANQFSVGHAPISGPTVITGGGTVYFNGDDAVALVRYPSGTAGTGVGVIVDLIGVIGEQPLPANCSTTSTGNWSGTNPLDNMGTTPVFVASANQSLLRRGPVSRGVSSNRNQNAPGPCPAPRQVGGYDISAEWMMYSTAFNGAGGTSNPGGQLYNRLGEHLDYTGPNGTYATTISGTLAKFDANISVYPNPAHGTATVEIKNAKVGSIQVLNNLGQRISAEATGLGQEKINLNISTLKPGLYFVQILSADGQTKIYKELVVQ